MKWIKSLSAKVVGNRLDGSPDAKMRRSLKRKASLSSPTASSSDNSWEGADAKWRVGTFLRGMRTVLPKKQAFFGRE